MPSFSRRYFPLLLPAVIAIGVGILWLKRPQEPEKSAITLPPAIPETTFVPRPTLSVLAQPPVWSKLDPYQRTITRADFERLLTTIFTVGEGWKNFIRLDESHAVIQANTPNEFYSLEFAEPDSPLPPPKTWRSTAELPSARADQPLAGLHIAIDPGHIGGDWAKMEERWFVLNGGKPVTEGDMTLYVAKLLQPKLEALGAKITLVRDKPEPVTPIRPESLINAAADSVSGTISQSPQKLAERLFYRTSEIHARAQVVNDTIKPDLVLCLHFNAEGWGDPLNPTLVPNTHLHLILNGAYNNEEISLADQRFAMIHKILQRTHEEEVIVGTTVANTFAEISKLPPYLYLPTNPNVRPIDGQPYLWARNLLANRLYDCPVIFMEPYVMNSVTDYARIQAGDYEGLQMIEGEMRPSIFKEYAEALTEGLVRHYSNGRKKSE